MEKLIELLNEYETPQSGIVFKSYDYYDGTFYGVDCDGETEIAWSDSLICSKKFGFIKWLVENKKIAYDIPNNSDLYKCFELACVPLDNTDYITMLLSIQDEPIEFLISILN